MISQKISKQKQVLLSHTQAKNHEKKLSATENQFKSLNQEMTSYRMKSTFLIGIFMIIALSSFGTLFQGFFIEKKTFFLVKNGIFLKKLSFFN